MPANYTPEEIQKAHEILYNEGIKMRYQVAGKEYVDKSLAAASNPFAKAMQDVSFSLLLPVFFSFLLSFFLPSLFSHEHIQYVSESCWGSIWT